MRVLRKAGILLVIVAAVLATAVSALGAKPEHPGKPPTTTTTVPEEPTLGGYTCEEYYGEAEYDAMLEEHDVVPGDDTIQFRLSGKKDFVCLDVNWDTEGTWEVDAIGNEGTTQIGRLLLVPRDSYAPGDECARADLRNVTLPLAQELLLPASTVNACGTQFGEWIDGVLVTTPTGESHPLAFFAQLMAGGPGASVFMTVTLP